MITDQEYNQDTGILTKVHQAEGKIVFEKAWDAQPLLDQCAQERAMTRGMRWGEGMTKVGTIPPAIVGMFIRQDGGWDAKRAEQWLKENPALVSFEGFLK